MWGHGEIKQTYKHRYGMGLDCRTTKATKGTRNNGTLSQPPVRPTLNSRSVTTQQPGAQKSKCLPAAQSDISALSPPTGPNTTAYGLQLPPEGPFNPPLSLKLAPYLAALSLSHLWADGQTGRARGKKEKCN